MFSSLVKPLGVLIDPHSAVILVSLDNIVSAACLSANTLAVIEQKRN